MKDEDKGPREENFLIAAFDDPAYECCGSILWAAVLKKCEKHFDETQRLKV